MVMALNTCTSQTTPFNLYAGSRYFNLIGNVAGSLSAVGSGYTGQYQYVASAATHGGTHYAAYTVGFTENSGWTNDGLVNGFALQQTPSTGVVHVDATGLQVTWDSGVQFNSAWAGNYIVITPSGGNSAYYPISTVNSATSITLSSGTGGALTGAGYSAQYATWDPLAGLYLMRWGNYDVVSAVVRWCGNSSDTGWAITCSSTSEVPSGISPYGNVVPTLGDTGAGQGALPASFFLSSKPSWMPSAVPWPVIGPDVAGGNVGICSGGTYAGFMAISVSQCAGGSLVTGLAGHANANAAMLCAYNVMGMNVAGTDGSALTFNEQNCYANGGGGRVIGPSSLVGPSSVH